MFYGDLIRKIQWKSTIQLLKCSKNLLGNFLKNKIILLRNTIYQTVQVMIFPSIRHSQSCNIFLIVMPHQCCTD